MTSTTTNIKIPCMPDTRHNRGERRAGFKQESACESKGINASETFWTKVKVKMMKLAVAFWTQREEEKEEKGGGGEVCICPFYKHKSCTDTSTVLIIIIVLVICILYFNIVTACSPARVGDVAVCVFDINQPSLPTPF